MGISGWAEYQSGIGHCTIRRKLGSGTGWKKGMADESWAIANRDWERDLVFDGDRAWNTNRASAENDRGQRDESAAGRDLEGLLARVFGRDGGAGGDRDAGKRDGWRRAVCLDLRD